MKIYTYYTESHKEMFENYFSKTIQDLEMVSYYGEQECASGSYYQDGWKKTTMKKVDVFIKACEENQGDIFVYSDVDIQFFGPLKETLIQELGDYDIAIQNDYLGGMCSGFFVCKGNERTLKMFESMKSNEDLYLEDQHALNMNLNFVKFKPLSHRFWTFGIYKTQWKNQNFDIPDDILMHHANWTEGLNNKYTLLNVVRNKMELKKSVQNNLDNYQEFLNVYFEEFRPEPTYPVYPPYHTGKYLEDYFFEHFNINKPNKEIFFIPVSWTTCYIENQNLLLLQEKLLSLDKVKNYFVVSQHDDAIREYLPPNTIKFCAGGNSGGTPLPLVCSSVPYYYISKYRKVDKNIFCSFVGSITHPIRKQMVEILKDDTNYYLKYGTWNNNLGLNDFENFADITGRSKYTLCPRGYGKNSFRMYEAMQFGSVPVYIYDDDWRPFKNLVDWDSFCISIHVSKLPELKNILENISEDHYKQMSDNLISVYNDFFKLESMSEKILKNL
jgi:hypothetical protein